MLLASGSNLGPGAGNPGQWEFVDVYEHLVDTAGTDTALVDAIDAAWTDMGASRSVVAERVEAAVETQVVVPAARLESNRLSRSSRPSLFRPMVLVPMRSTPSRCRLFPK
ncbi:MAG: hypothetical protein AAGA68_21140 [Pseudomonadota bacterium]